MIRFSICLYMVSSLLVAGDLADLEVLDVSHNAEIVDPNETIPVTLIVRNRGNAPAFDIFVSLYMSQDRNCGGDAIAVNGGTFIKSLDVGRSTTLNLHFDAPPTWNEVYVTAVVDPFNAIPESLENNNCLLSFDFITIRQPDLLSFDGTQPVSRIARDGFPFEYRFTVSNSFDSRSRNAPPSTSYIYLAPQGDEPDESNRLPLEITVGKLKPGNTDTLIAPVEAGSTLPLGNYVLYSQANGDGALPEQDTSNNFTSGLPVEVVEFCSLVDFNADGSVTSNDFAMVASEQGQLVDETNEHFNLVPALDGDTDIIDIADLRIGLPCWGTRDAPAPAGSLNGFDLVANGVGFDLNLDVTGPVKGISAHIKLPGQATLDQALTLDVLDTGFKRDLVKDAQSYVLLNQHNTWDYSGSDLDGTYNLAYLESGDLDLSQLEDLPTGAKFRAGITLRVLFVDGTETLISKGFRYFHSDDPIMQAAVETFYGLAPGEAIPFDLTQNTQSLVLNDMGLHQLDGLEAFGNLKVIKANDNDLTSLPDLSGLPLLQVIKIRRNQITTMGALPASITHIRMDGNQLTGLPELSHCANLDYLQLYDNQLTQLPDLSQNTKLRVLMVDNNRLKSLPGLPVSLAELHAHQNDIQGELDLGDAAPDLVFLHSNQIAGVDALLHAPWQAGTRITLEDNYLDMATDYDTVKALAENPNFWSFDYEYQKNGSFRDWSLVASFPLDATGVETFVGSLSQDRAVNVVEGQHDEALAFDAAVGSEIVHADLPQIPLGNSPRSITGFLNLESYNQQDMTLFDFGPATLQNGTRVTVQVNHGYLVLSTGTQSYLASGNRFREGFWDQWAVTYDGAGTWVLWINTFEVGRITLNTQTQSGPLTLGNASVFPGSGLVGSLDAIKIYSRALSEDDLVADFVDRL